MRDTDALFMQHRKVNISTKRRRRHRVPVLVPLAVISPELSRRTTITITTTTATTTITRGEGSSRVPWMQHSWTRLVLVVVLGVLKPGPRPSHPEPGV